MTDEIRKLCQRYCHPGTNPGAHFLAYKVLEIIAKWEREKAKEEANPST